MAVQYVYGFKPMKKYAAILMLTIGLLLTFGYSAKAQFRSQEPSPLNYTGPITKTVTVSHDQKGLLDLFNIHNVKMQNSLEMSFSSFGGHVYNENLFTNTMFMNFTPRLSGRLDISLAASPFGNGLFTQSQKPRIFVRNAELNYQLSKNSSIHLQFSEMPYASPYSPYGGGYYGYYGNPFFNNGFYGNR